METECFNNLECAYFNYFVYFIAKPNEKRDWCDQDVNLVLAKAA
jgi:hypothetical protein